MAKKLIRLTEQDLHRIVKESVNMILKEGNYAQDKARNCAKKWFKLFKNGDPSTKGVITPEIQSHLGTLARFEDKNCEKLGMKVLENLYGDYYDIPSDVISFADTVGKTLYDLLWRDSWGDKYKRQSEMVAK